MRRERAVVHCAVRMDEPDIAHDQGEPDRE
jgi:hypothetical protein